MYHVHGERGEDPTEPTASAPYPHPAVSHEPRMQQLSDDFARAGSEAVSHTARHHAGREEPAIKQMYPLQHVRRPSRA